MKDDCESIIDDFERCYERQQRRELEQDAQDNFEYYKSGGMFEQILGPMSEGPEEE